MNLEKLKDTARKYEQKEDWRRAIDVYLKAIHEFESGKDPHPDLSLYNRVGDLYMKVNDTAAAVRSYERAADLYTEQGFLNNAIALCGKILRVNPSRTQIYFKLAQIHARKNMVVDAKRHLVEYLERMNRGGQLDEAFQAVKVFADQFSGNQEIRVMLIELLRAASRDEEAKEQLEKLAGELEARGDRVGALRTREQIEAIAAGHPSADGEPTTATGVSGLVFLDTGRQGVVTPPRLVAATPPVQVPRTPVMHASPPMVPTPPAMSEFDTPAEELIVQPVDEETPADDVPPLEFLDVGAPLDGTASGGIVEFEALVDEPSFAHHGSETPDGMLLGDIELTVAEEPEEEQTVEPLDGLVRIDTSVEPTPAPEGLDLLLEPAFDDARDVESRPLDGLELVGSEMQPSGDEDRAAESPMADDAEVLVDLPGAVDEFDAAEGEAVPVDGSIDEFSDDVGAVVEHTAPAAGDGEFSVAEFDAGTAVEETEPSASDFAVVAGEPWQPTGLSRSVDELEERILDDPEDPESHRELGEALMMQGETARAVDEFELALAGYETAGDQEHAEALLALLITLQPEDVRFYQRRVEYAYRTGDRDHLLGAYLDLADVLARVQAEDKAIAVYWRVLEHEPDNARAQLALQLLGVLDLEPQSESESATGSEQVAAATPELDAEPFTAEADDSEHEEPSVLDVPADAAAAPAVEEPAARTESAARPLPSPDEFIDLGSLVIDEDDRPRDTRMTGQQVESTGDEQRDFEEMLAQFKRGIDENVDLDDYQAHYDLGVAFKEMGLLDEAVAEFQRALRAPEGRLRTCEALGMCFYEKGQFPVAEAVLRRAVDTLPGGDDEKIGLIYWLARSAEEQGKADTARALYERALAVDIRFQDTNERINRLMTGRQ